MTLSSNFALVFICKYDECMRLQSGRTETTFYNYSDNDIVVVLLLLLQIAKTKDKTPVFFLSFDKVKNY